MKIKNLGFFEKNIEKMVLALAGVFFLIVMGFFFLGSPFKATLVGVPEPLSPGQIEDHILGKVNDLDRQLQLPEPPIPPMPVPNFSRDVLVRITQPLSPVSRYLVPPGGTGLDKSLYGSGATEVAVAALPESPTPTQPVARADFAVLAETKRINDWLKLVGRQTPRDFRYASVAASFDLGAWRKSLKNSNIPEEWWDGVIMLTHLELERETLDPLTQTWGQRQTIAYLPTQAHFDHLSPALAEQSTAQIAELIRSQQMRITQPAFAPLTNDRAWLPPDVPAQKLSLDQRRQLVEIIRQINVKKRQMQKTLPSLLPLEDQEEDQPLTPDGGSAPTPNPINQPVMPPSMDPMIYGPQIVPGGTNLPPGVPGAPGTHGAPGIPVPSGIDQELDLLQRQRDAVIAGQDPRTIAPRADAPIASVSSSKIDLLTHDLTVQPGQTYRYRLRVGVFNPLFRRGNQLEDKQRDLTKQLAILSSASAWSTPVEVWPERLYFLVKTNVELGTTTWEVYRILKGRWVAQSFDARPGDLIGRLTQVKVDDKSYDVDMQIHAALIDVEPTLTRFGPTGRAIAMNVADGSIFEHTVADDQESPRYRHLREEIRQQAASVAPPIVNPVPTPVVPPVVVPPRGNPPRGTRPPMPPDVMPPGGPSRTPPTIPPHR